MDPQEPIFWIFCRECRKVRRWGRDLGRDRERLDEQLRAALKDKCGDCGTEQHLTGVVQTRLEAAVRMREMELQLLSDPLAPEKVHADTRDL